MRYSPEQCTLPFPSPPSTPLTHADAEKFGIQCFCVNDPDLESINKYEDESSEVLCTDTQHKCSGDADEQCGGRNAMSVYAISASGDAEEPTTEPTPSPTPEPTPATPTPATAGGLGARDGFLLSEILQRL